MDETGRVLSDDRALLVVLDLIAAERRGGAVALRRLGQTELARPVTPPVARSRQPWHSAVSAAGQALAVRVSRWRMGMGG